MEKKELDQIIELLESSNSTDDAYLALKQYGGGPDESYAKANKEGLELLAVKLLKASRDFDNITNNNEEHLIPLDYEEKWIDGEICIHYVEPINQKGNQIKEEKIHSQTFFQKLIPSGCIVITILVLISAIVGFITIFKWIFK